MTDLADTPDDDSDSLAEYTLLRQEYQTAVRDADALIVKLAVAGLTLSAAARSILTGVDWLLASAVVLFAIGAVSSLTSLRLAAVALGAQVGEVATGVDPGVAYIGQKSKHRWVRRLDWVAYGTVTAGLLAAMLFAAGASPVSPA